MTKNRLAASWIWILGMVFASMLEAHAADLRRIEDTNVYLYTRRVLASELRSGVSTQDFLLEGLPGPGRILILSAGVRVEVPFQAAAPVTLSIRDQVDEALVMNPVLVSDNTVGFRMGMGVFPTWHSSELSCRLEGVHETTAGDVTVCLYIQVVQTAGAEGPAESWVHRRTHELRRRRELTQRREVLPIVESQETEIARQLRLLRWQLIQREQQARFYWGVRNRIAAHQEQVRQTYYTIVTRYPARGSAGAGGAIRTIGSGGGGGMRTTTHTTYTTVSIPGGSRSGGGGHVTVSRR